ncbi:MAG: CofH family radical SAM protein, partial [Verrucomicrobiae bacterium]
MNFFIQRSELRDIYHKVVAGERITDADALRLFETKDLNALGAIADFVRQKKNGNRASFIINRYVNYSNYCILSCQFCSFARKKRDADGFQLSVEEIIAKAREALKLGITELHIVGGLHPSLPFSYYTDMLKALKNLDARLQLKCFTAIEILHLAWLAKKSVEQTLIELKDAGLASLTGGGAEIFRKEVRSAIAKGKESAEEYLDVHRTWHKLGGRSTCTMLYGHVESLADRVDHLRQLRALQDETQGFTALIPLAYQPENNDIPVKTPPTGFDSLRTIAVSRIYLDNFPHITAYWVGLGMKLAQVALNYGADD